MHYFLDFSYENVVVPMNDKTTAAIQVLFGSGVSYDETYKDGKNGLYAKPRSFRIRVIGDDELRQQLENGYKFVEATNP
jgi:hypothetical protein